ncbi:hypothetical protein ACFPM0_21830 [Pseudonocardia sulfidoxydans]|uniref:hypothetical protein n=1 Tax=Pseudonocardia sulfidoxydans TaxID=54011 RepID=UPI003618D9FE
MCRPSTGTSSANGVPRPDVDSQLTTASRAHDHPLHTITHSSRRLVGANARLGPAAPGQADTRHPTATLLRK